MRSWGDSRTCRATVIRDILRGRLAADPDPHGLRLRGARISGRLDLENLSTDVSLELSDCLLEEGVLARDARLASVGLTGCQLEHPAEPPLDADTAHLQRAADLDAGAERSSATPSDRRGPPGSAPTSAAASTARGEPAQRLRPRPGRRRPAGRPGHVPQRRVHRHRRRRARRGPPARRPHRRQLDCAGASLRNDSGPALAADGLQVDQAMFLRGGFTATGGGESGAVRLTGAHIGGQLDCAGASCATTPAPPWSPTACRSTRPCSSPAGSPPPAAGRRGVAGRSDGCAGGLGRCSCSTPAAAWSTRPILTGARGGRADLRRCAPSRSPARDWLDLLRDGTPGYAAQPYQQLAAGYRALGDERQAREILMAQRDDQLARTHTRWPERLWGRITKVTLGYGYQPWRALLFLAAVVAVSCVLAVVLGSHGALAQTEQDGDPGPAVHGGPAGQRGTGSQPAGGHQRGPGGLRPDQGFGQCDRGLADRCRLGVAATGMGVRGAVHRRLHQRRTQDMTGVTAPPRQVIA